MTELIIKVDDDFLREAKLKGMEEQFELVRCKDCKYAEENWGGRDIYCSRTSSFPWAHDSFCSDGERKRGEADET